MKKQKIKGLAVAMFAAFALLTASACATSQAVGGKPAVVYYAAVVDFVIAKEIAASYAELPSTPQEHRVALYDIAVKGDKVVAEIEALRLSGGVPDDRYALAARLLQTAARELEKYAATGGAR
jgi:hypothetical protein